MWENQEFRSLENLFGLMKADLSGQQIKQEIENGCVDPKFFRDLARKCFELNSPALGDGDIYVETAVWIMDRPSYKPLANSLLLETVSMYEAKHSEAICLGLIKLVARADEQTKNPDYLLQGSEFDAEKQDLAKIARFAIQNEDLKLFRTASYFVGTEQFVGPILDRLAQLDVLDLKYDKKYKPLVESLAFAIDSIQERYGESMEVRDSLLEKLMTENDLSEDDWEVCVVALLRKGAKLPQNLPEDADQFFHDLGRFQKSIMGMVENSMVDDCLPMQASAYLSSIRGVVNRTFLSSKQSKKTPVTLTPNGSMSTAYLGVLEAQQAFVCRRVLPILDRQERKIARVLEKTAKHKRGRAA